MEDGGGSEEDGGLNEGVEVEDGIIEDVAGGSYTVLELARRVGMAKLSK